MADGGHTRDLVIPEIEASLMRPLEALAREHGRSLPEEARAILARSLGVIIETDEELAERTRAFLKAAAEIRAMTPEGIDQGDSTLLIREARDNGYWRDL